MAKDHTSALGLFYNNGQSFKWQPNHNIEFNTYFNDFKENTRYQITFTYDGLSYRIWRNGVLINNIYSNNGNIPDNLNDNVPCTMGARYVPSIEYSDSIELHEFIFNNTNVCDDIIDNITNYLCNKWLDQPINKIVFGSSENTITFQTIDEAFSITNTLIDAIILNNNNPVTKLSGIIDQLNTFTISINESYENIELTNLDNTIKYTRDNNNIIFDYDPGFELQTTFYIINDESREIYETIEVDFVDLKI